MLCQPARTVGHSHGGNFCCYCCDASGMLPGGQNASLITCIYLYLKYGVLLLLLLLLFLVLIGALEWQDPGS